MFTKGALQEVSEDSECPYSYAKMIPVGRTGTAEEGADAVYPFCSPESSYIGSQTITAGGGLRI
jgi:NAD(P)-dependent dehydrogenase (short-subunit alcohol dehydrogenase family)